MQDEGDKIDRRTRMKLLKPEAAVVHQIGWISHPCSESLVTTADVSLTFRGTANYCFLQGIFS